MSKKPLQNVKVGGNLFHCFPISSLFPLLTLPSASTISAAAMPTDKNTYTCHARNPTHHNYRLMVDLTKSESPILRHISIDPTTPPPDSSRCRFVTNPFIS